MARVGEKPATPLTVTKAETPTVEGAQAPEAVGALDQAAVHLTAADRRGVLQFFQCPNGKLNGPMAQFNAPMTQSNKSMPQSIP